MGRITTRHRGGGHSTHRLVDFRRNKGWLPATVGASNSNVRSLALADVADWRASYIMHEGVSCSEAQRGSQVQSRRLAAA